MSKTKYICGEETSTVLLDIYTCSYKIVSVLEHVQKRRDCYSEGHLHGVGRPPIGELECITPCSLLRETLSFCKPCPAAVSLGRQKIRVPDVKYNYNIVHSPCPM